MPASESVDHYLDSLPEDRAAALRAVRQVVLANLPPGYEETVQYGMIGYVVPHSVFPPGYHCDPKEPLPFCHLGSQKNHMAVYLMPLYSDEGLLNWFVEEYKKTGKRLDMGKSCVRFKKLDDLPVELIGQVVAKVPVDVYVGRYRAALDRPRTRKA